MQRFAKEVWRTVFASLPVLARPVPWPKSPAPRRARPGYQDGHPGLVGVHDLQVLHQVGVAWKVVLAIRRLVPFVLGFDLQAHLPHQTAHSFVVNHLSLAAQLRCVAPVAVGGATLLRKNRSSWLGYSKRVGIVVLRTEIQSVRLYKLCMDAQACPMRNSPSTLDGIASPPHPLVLYCLCYTAMASSKDTSCLFALHIS